MTGTFDVAFDGRTYRGVDGIDPFATNPPDINRGDTFVLNSTDTENNARSPR